MRTCQFDLNSYTACYSLAVSLSILAASIGSLGGASYSTFCEFLPSLIPWNDSSSGTADGRRPIYLVGTPLLLVGSLGVAASRSVPELMFWRFIQAFGASPGLAVGSGVIGDIYKLEERGQALGIFFSVSRPIYPVSIAMSASLYLRRYC